MRLVVHFGLHKTATTWLQQHLLPAMATDGVRVLGNSSSPWDDLVLRYLVLGEGTADQALSLLGGRGTGSPVGVLSAERLSGHPAANWFDAPQVARRVHALQPDHVLLMLRDQVTHVPSVYAQLVRAGWTGTVAELLDDDPSGQWKRPRLALSGFEHDRRVRDLFELFGRERVTVLHYETLRDDPRAFVAAVLDVLWADRGRHPRLDELVQTTETRVLVTRQRSLALDRFLNHFRRAPLQPSPALDLGRVTGSRAASWVVERWPGGRGLLEGAHDALLRERFADSNARLEQLLSTDG